MTTILKPPGLYPNVPFAEYLRYEGLSQTALKAGLRSPKHLRHAATQAARPPSPAQILGEALHTRVLEPERFASRLEAAPVNPRTGEAYGPTSKMYREFAENMPGSIILGREELADVEAMAASIMAHPQARPLIAAKGSTEVVAIWDDAETGIRLKGRRDKYIPGELALDIKTTINAHPGAFSRSINDYGYHIQEAVYADGFEQYGAPKEQVIIAVENEAPFDCVVYVIDAEAVSIGRLEYQRLLRVEKRCREANHWPGFSDEVESIGLPLWAMKRYEDGE